MRKLPNRLRRGSAAVEFAFSMLFVLVPLLGVTLDWGWYFYRQLAVQNIVRDGVRVAVMSDITTSYRDSVAEHWITAQLDEAGFEPGVDFDSADIVATDDDVAETVTVSATVTFNHLLNLLPVGPPDALVVNYTMPY